MFHPVRPIYFWHIPKTAGSSVRKWLVGQFPAEHVFPHWLLEDLHFQPRNSIGNYQLFCGHFHGYLLKKLGTNPYTITVLRDPVLRTYSHWHHIKRTVTDPNHERVRGQSFEEFVDDDANRIVIENFQARYLAATSEPLEQIATGLGPEDLKQFKLSLRADALSLKLDRNFLLRGACETLDQMEVVGTTDDVPRFLRDCARRFDREPPLPDDVPRVNRIDAAKTFGISATAFRRIVALTEIDQELYERARAAGGQTQIYPDKHQQRWLETEIKLIFESLDRAEDTRLSDRRQIDWTTAEVISVRRYLDGLHEQRQQDLARTTWLTDEAKRVREYLDGLHEERLRDRDRFEKLNAELDHMRARAERLEGALEEIHEEIQLSKRELDAIYRSRSFRWTAPLRRAFAIFRRLAD